MPAFECRSNNPNWRIRYDPATDMYVIEQKLVWHKQPVWSELSRLTAEILHDIRADMLRLQLRSVDGERVDAAIKINRGVFAYDTYLLLWIPPAQTWCGSGWIPPEYRSRFLGERPVIRGSIHIPHDADMTISNVAVVSDEWDEKVASDPYGPFYSTKRSEELRWLDTAVEAVCRKAR